MKQISLSGGLSTIVDDDVYEWATRLKLRVHANRSGNHYVYFSRGGKTLLLHREIVGAKSGEIIDHRHGDTLDNRRSMLRIATRSQNNVNRSGRRPGPKGVSQAADGTWRATISQNGVRKTITGLVSQADAARAYDHLAVNLYGEFAWLNTPRNSLPLRYPPLLTGIGYEIFRNRSGMFYFRYRKSKKLVQYSLRTNDWELATLFAQRDALVLIYQFFMFPHPYRTLLTRTHRAISKVHFSLPPDCTRATQHTPNTTHNPKLKPSPEKRRNAVYKGE